MILFTLIHCLRHILKKTKKDENVRDEETIDKEQKTTLKVLEAILEANLEARLEAKQKRNRKNLLREQPQIIVN